LHDKIIAEETKKEGELCMYYEDKRKQEMYNWFRERFVEPESCDISESAKSGYQYACGGPYFPKDVIPGQFCKMYPSGLIMEVVNDLNAESAEWALRKKESVVGGQFYA
jgi:hypothetical protein